MKRLILVAASIAVLALVNRAILHKERLIADGETVFRCTAGDAGSLAAAIAAALDNPERRESVGLAGRQRVLERRTWRRCAEMTVAQATPATPHPSPSTK